MAVLPVLPMLAVILIVAFVSSGAVPIRALALVLVIMFVVLVLLVAELLVLQTARGSSAQYRSAAACDGDSKLTVTGGIAH